MIKKIHKNKLNSYNKNIGKNIRYYRKIRSISQVDIAGILGIDKSTISLYENGKVNIPVKHLYAISNFLDIKISLFFEAYEDKFKHIYDYQYL